MDRPKAAVPAVVALFAAAVLALPGPAAARSYRLPSYATDSTPLQVVLVPVDAASAEADMTLATVSSGD